MLSKSLTKSSRALCGMTLGAACLALGVSQGEARAACIDTLASTATNCELFDSSAGNTFSLDLFSAPLGTASAQAGGQFQLVLDGLLANQNFSFTGLQLALIGGSGSTTVNLGSGTFTANNIGDPSYFSTAASFSSLGIGTITSAVLTGTFGVTAPVTGAPPTTFFAGLRFNSSGANTGGLLNVTGIGGGGVAFGENTLGSEFTNVPGPLPVLGAGVAFGFSRRLRKRISAS